MKPETVTTLEHHGYSGSVEVSVEDGCLHGRLLHIVDIITYEGRTVPDVATAFEVAVDEYLEHCRTIGKTPNRPYSGTFNVRVGPERHRQLALLAARTGSSINETMCRVIDKYFRPVTVRLQTGPGASRFHGSTGSGATPARDAWTNAGPVDERATN
jgi:predicted HicB family RNase H-like nuclease